MNRTYRIVFNRSAGLWQVVSEHVRGQGKGGRHASRSARRRLPFMAVLLTALGAAGQAQAGPIVTFTGDATFAPFSGPNLVAFAPLYVGMSGVGTLTAADGGQVTILSGNTVILADSASADGTINIGAAPGAAPVGAGFLATSLLQFGAGTGTLNFNTNSFHDFSAALVSRDAGTHQLNHYAGSTRLVGNSSGFAGNTTVTGGSLQILNVLGTAEGRIDAGQAPGATAQVSVFSPGSTWALTDNLFVGGAGPGELSIFSSGTVSNQFATVDAQQNDAAKVTVSDVGSLWSNRAVLLVGTEGGMGSVSILAGGYVTSVDGVIGRRENGSGVFLVSGRGSAWTNSGELRVGDVSGQGTLNIESGGVVSNKDSYVGSMSGNGSVVVRGAGSIWNNSGAMTLGFGVGTGAGSLTIAQGGTVSVGASGGGTVSLAQDRFLVFPTTGTINIGAALGQPAVGAGTLNAGAVQFGAGIATVNFNHTDPAYAFSTPLLSTGAGSHSLNQIAGTTLLTGANGSFRGRTTVSGGRLVVLGQLGGSAAVTGGVLQFGDGATGAANTLSGDLKVSGAGSTLAVQGGAKLGVTGNIEMADGTVLDLMASSGGQPLQANKVTLGDGVEFRLSGIADKSGLDTVLIQAPTGGIDGDFSAVSVGGFTGEVDYLTVHTRKSADNTQYLATYGLSWTANTNLAHGTFTLSDAANRFVVGVDLADQAANAATGWNGRSLLKAGAGTLVLSGNNTYSGGTTIAGGTLQVASDANLGAASGGVAFNGGTLAASASFDTARDMALMQAGRFEVAGGATLGLVGAVSGNADLIKTGAGTLRLDSAGNAYGNTRIQEGTLIGNAGSIRGNVDNNGTLVFDQGANATFGGAISGGGALVKSGAGTLGLTGDSSGFAGTTTVLGGRLALNGKLGGALNIGQGGVLGGRGTVGSGAGSMVTVAAGGTLAPGNSIGTLTVDGDLVIEKGARYAVETNPQGTDADLVHVTGSATINGGSVAHIGIDGDYALGSVYTILRADGALSGRFDTVTSDYAFLMPRLQYDYGAGRVSLELARSATAMASAAATRNQRAAAGAIDSIGMGAGNGLYDAIVALPDDKGLLRSSFDQLSGEIHASAKTVLLEDSRYVRDAANERLRSAAGSVGASAMP
ncbi:autotransporter-associated beta strand repeat-containing protein, partial [Achromobacter sp.]|uniref:autotransporter-associated beta strand repeat-containing protein n=1 Tax=Achromobacter sp. TaxID=134375 RepID=UPI002F952BDB